MFASRMPCRVFIDFDPLMVYSNGRALQNSTFAYFKLQPVVVDPR